MIVRIAALSALFASGLAAAQSGGITLTSGAAGSITAVDSANFGFIELQPFDPGDFQVIYTPVTVRVFTIADFTSMANGATRPPEPSVPVIDPAAFDPQPLAVVEGDGVRLPDERLDTVRR